MEVRASRVRPRLRGPAQTTTPGPTPRRLVEEACDQDNLADSTLRQDNLAAAPGRSLRTLGCARPAPSVARARTTRPVPQPQQARRAVVWEAGTHRLAEIRRCVRPLAAPTSNSRKQSRPALSSARRLPPRCRPPTSRCARPLVWAARSAGTPIPPVVTVLLPDRPPRTWSRWLGKTAEATAAWLEVQEAAETLRKTTRNQGSRAIRKEAAETTMTIPMTNPALEP